jgi:transposase
VGERRLPLPLHHRGCSSRAAGQADGVQAILADRAEQYRSARQQFDEAREALSEAVRAATQAGMRQADIVRAIDHLWTREHVRKIVTAVQPSEPIDRGQGNSRE